MGFIALYVTVCMNLSQPGSCVTEYITDSTQNDLNMTSCMGIEGLNSLPRNSSRSTRSTIPGRLRAGAARLATARLQKKGPHNVNAYHRRLTAT
jgi:hypothetical protein